MWSKYICFVYIVDIMKLQFHQQFNKIIVSVSNSIEIHKTDDDSNTEEFPWDEKNKTNINNTMW